MIWTLLDTQIVIIGALCAMSAALLGNFLVLRRMSMMGDAISHAVLPGLALAFLLTGSRASSVMLIGAGVVGVLTAALTQAVHRSGGVDQGASMGVVFTTLFAIGLVILERAARNVDLDPGCVLYGALEPSPLNTVTLLGWDVPRAMLTNGIVLLLNVGFVTLFYKELKISTFDPQLATTLGFDATWLHYLLMTMVAITTVVAFESVGSVLVIAMLIVPAATAVLLTDRLLGMLLISVAVAALSALLGHLGALHVPGWFGYPGVDTSTAGMMTVVAGGLLAVAVVAGPRHGLIRRALRQLDLTLRIAEEDLLGLLYRFEEAGRTATRPQMVAVLQQAGGLRPWIAHLALRRLARAALVDDASLTPAGRRRARDLVGAHRLWETYLDQHLELPSDHLHAPAERLEHITTPGMRRQLEDEVQQPTHDPHGRPIPRDETSE